MKLNNNEQTDLVDWGTRKAIELRDKHMSGSEFTDKQRKQFVDVCLNMLMHVTYSDDPLKTLSIMKEELDK